VLGFAPSTGTLGQDTQALLSELRIVNPAMQAQGGSRQVLIGGQPALLTEVSGASPYGGAERNTIVTAQRPEGLFYAVFVAPAAAFEQASPVFQAMYDSIRF
jgi:hypothetical protein